MNTLKIIFVVIIEVFLLIFVVTNEKITKEISNILNKNIENTNLKKNKKLYILFIVILSIFTFSIVNKTLQNDTYFYIPIGEYILNSHTIDGLDHWSFHENLKFTYPRLDL